MSQSISPAARAVQDGEFTDDYEVVLILIQHPDIEEDVCVSSDPTEVISYEPYQMGTRSTWLGSRKDFLFVSMGIDLPDDTDDAPMQASLVIDILDSEIANILTSTIVPAKVSIALVMRSSPDFIERQFLGLEMSDAEGDGGSISLQFSRRYVLEEPCPADRTTKERFPGLHP